MPKIRMNDTTDEGQAKQGTKVTEAAATTEGKPEEKVEDTTTDTAKAVDTKEPAEFVKRMQTEAKELEEKLVKLSNFVNDSADFKALKRNEQALMAGQMKAMNTYLYLLNQRINLQA